MNNQNLFPEIKDNSVTLWDKFKCKLFGKKINFTSWDEGSFTHITGYKLGGVIYIFDISSDNH